PPAASAATGLPSCCPGSQLGLVCTWKPCMPGAKPESAGVKTSPYGVSLTVTVPRLRPVPCASTADMEMDRSANAGALTRNDANNTNPTRCFIDHSFG